MWIPILEVTLGGDREEKGGQQACSAREVEAVTALQLPNAPFLDTMRASKRSSFLPRCLLVSALACKSYLQQLQHQQCWYSRQKNG